MPCIEADAPYEARTGHRAGRDERPAGNKPVAGVDTHLTDPLTSADGKLEHGGGDDAFHERLVDPHGAGEPPSRNERNPRPGITHPGGQVHPPRPNEPDLPGAGDPPTEQG